MSKQRLPILILLLIFIYLVGACIKLDYPGLHYDEILFGNAALGGIDNSFIHKRIYGIPIMLMPYIGAVKSSFYYFIFLIFNPSYISIRLPMILLSAISLWIIYKYTAKAGNNSLAVLSVLFLVADSSFISLTRTDVGPVVFGLFFRSLACLYFFKFIQTRNNNYLVVTSISLLLGLYDKLNFIWFIIAFFVSAFIFYQSGFSSIYEILKTKSAKILTSIFVIAFAGLCGFIIKLGITSELQLLWAEEHTKIVYNNLFHLTNGTAFYEMVFGEWEGINFVAILIWSIIIIGSVLAIFQSKTDRKSFHFFNVLIFILILLQILLTKQAEAPWHVFMIQPTLAILLSSSLIFICEVLFSYSQKCKQIILLGSAGIIFSLQLFIFSAYIVAYEKPYRAFIWSKKIDDLFIYSQSVPMRFVSIDWGTHTQLLTLNHKAGKYYQLLYVPNATNLELLEQLKKEYFDPSNHYYFILHSDTKTISKPSRLYFFETSSSLGLKPKLVETINENNELLFEIYQLEQNINQ